MVLFVLSVKVDFVPIWHEVKQGDKNGNEQRRDGTRKDLH